MTETEAIRVIKNSIAPHEILHNPVFHIAMDMAIKALTRQIPCKPETPDDYELMVYKECICPTCGKFLNDITSGNYCTNCGQRIDWSGTET